MSRYGKGSGLGCLIMLITYSWIFIKACGPIKVKFEDVLWFIGMVAAVAFWIWFIKWMRE